jgi:Undecaprenyl-phosphate galactose phosphotransferase WbaP
MEGLSSLGVSAGSVSGLFGISIRQDLHCMGPKIAKRAFDLAVAAALGVVLLPLLAVVWAMVKLSSAGPGFYGQRRIGEGGKYFKIWKFRTMVVNAEHTLADYLAKHPELCAEWLRLHKLKNDPRNTPIGRILRRTSLDELPQLWSILRGKMSLVGPRPIVDREVEKYADDFEYYLQVRPGVTGLWQVSGRNNTSYAERVALDRFYVRNWSVWLDLYILAKTVRTVFTGHGAY